MKWLLVCLIFIVSETAAQVDSTKWLRGFPITEYLVKLNDSVTVVQLDLPEGPTLKDKQLGILRGVYQLSNADTVMKGYGRCHLIKGNYYYFSIGNDKSGVPPKKGDLIYTLLEKPTVYTGRILKLAAHFILLKTVYQVPLYDRHQVFTSWDTKKEIALIDSIVADIQFTGNYFQANDNSMDTTIQSGPFKGKRVLQMMITCTRTHVENFLDYMIARPRLYAGREWLVTEIYGTWLSHGSPTVISR